MADIAGINGRTMAMPGGAVGGACSELGDYWTLLKPNVMKLVVFTGIVGMLIAPGALHPVLAVTAILCIAAGAGASAAINNAYDADIDRSMVRTQKRPTAAGRILPAEALGTGIVLAILSVMVMGLAVNWLAAGLLALTIVFYIGIYTMWLKRSTPQNIVIGGAAGAFPPMIGWAAVTGSVDVLPLVMFAIIFLWTPPHFWALALYRMRDYGKVGVPMLPVVAGREVTRLHILGYTIVLLTVSLVPVLTGDLGLVYGCSALLLGGIFTGYALRLWRRDSDVVAMRAFRFSIVYLFALFSLMVVDHWVHASGLLV